MKTFEAKKKRNNGIKRLIFCGISIILEFIVSLSFITNLNTYAEILNILTRITATILVLDIYSRNTTSTIKTPWIIIILVAPVLGVSLYFFTGLNSTTRKMKMRYEKIDNILLPQLPAENTVSEEIYNVSKGAGGISKYIYNFSRYPAYRNRELKYFSDASDALEAMKNDLAKAEKFIFMEYFAIENKETWMSIQKILEQKVKEGVEVRVFYDDIGSIGFVNLDFINQLKSVGIQCRVFNPFMPFVNMFLNNRDHRKLTVIDGKTGYTGGYNLANEYFNITHPYGKWKDTGIRFEGEAVLSLTATFLEMWNAVKESDIDDQHPEKYLVCDNISGCFSSDNGFIQPYADSPINGEQLGESVYISILNKADRYCWFMTPYLVITDEMINAFSLAAKRGVDVRIITPGIPDKKAVYRLTKSFYSTLVGNGVRIFEWTPGFCHAKMCISDDIIATCGTINLDYRSLYHHFENSCLMINCDAVNDIKNDFIHTFNECTEVTRIYSEPGRKRLRIGQMILRMFAELF
mgnify:CR=1 FL=1